MIIVKR